MTSGYYAPGSGEIHRITYRASALDAPAPLAAPARLTLRPQPSLVSAGPLRFSTPLGEAGTLAPGVYRAALSQGNLRRTAQVVITR